MRRAFVGGICEQTHPVCLDAVGDPHLAAINDVIVAVAAGAGTDISDVGTRFGLADTDTADLITGDRWYQELLAQILATEARQRWRAHIRLHADRHGHAAAMDMAQRFGEDHGVGIVKTHTAIFLRLVDAEKASLAELLEKLVGGKDLCFLPVIHVGIDLLIDKAMRGIA